VVLRWTSTCDGKGGSASYALRSGSPDFEWESATRTERVIPAPDGVGEIIEYTYTGLDPATEYEFQLVSLRGSVWNWVTGRSNRVRVSTAAGVKSISVSPSSTNLAVGAKQTLTATTRDSHNNTLTGRTVTWSSSNQKTATVSSGGVVEALAVGTVTITATSEGVSATATITATAVSVASVRVSPTSASIMVGSTQALTATARDASGNTLPGRAFTWSSGNAAVATVASDGVVTAKAAGNTTITVTSEGKTATVAITVTVVPVASVAVSPSSSAITVNSTETLVATTRDASNNTLTGRTVTWSSSNQAVATVSATGVVTGRAAGTATITATSEGRSGTAAVTITTVPVASVAVSPTTASITVGTTQTLTATTRDASNNALTGRTVTWSSSNQAVATVSTAGVVTASATGTATITATSEGKTATTAITVTAVPVATVVVSPTTASIAVGATQTLTATTRDAGNNTLTGRTVTWSTSNQTVATVSAAGVVTASTTGTATITATSEGKTATAAITVTAVPVATVVVSPTTSSIAVGATQTLTATTRDAGNNTLTGRTVTWSSSNQTVATVSATGVVTARATGTATITATSEGRTATATITVTTSNSSGPGAKPAAAPAIVEDFSTYTSTANFISDPRGIYNRVEDQQTSRITLDTDVLFNGHPTMRYDWPVNAVEPTITRMLRLPARTRKVWVEWWSLYPTNFLDGVSAKKVLFVHGDNGSGLIGRFAVNMENGPGGSFNAEGDHVGGIYEGPGGWYRRGPANREILDGKWHRHRVAVDLDVPRFRYWLDDTLRTDAVAEITITGLGGVSMGRNFNRTPAVPVVERWGEIRIWTTDPGW
jgi:uncharacterized protein YjdB